MTVLIDTSALMMPVERDVRLFDELERLLGDVACAVPEPVVAELESLDNRAGEPGAAAGVGLDLLEHCEIRETDADYADDAVVELAESGGFSHVVTNDATLQDRVRTENVPVIGLRGGHKLAIIH